MQTENNDIKDQQVEMIKAEIDNHFKEIGMLYTEKIKYESLLQMVKAKTNEHMGNIAKLENKLKEKENG